MNVILVVGPSGSGKDTLLRNAKEHFEDNEMLVFARRYITRPADTNEDNYYVDSQAFSVLENMQFFISTWQAHQHLYGIPKHTVQKGNSNTTVVCSVSRSAIQDFELSCDSVSTILITAKEEILRQRLLGRGREKRGDIDIRLRRAKSPVHALNLTTFDNSYDLRQSIDAFNSLLHHLCSRKAYASI